MDTVILTRALSLLGRYTKSTGSGFRSADASGSQIKADMTRLTEIAERYNVPMSKDTSELFQRCVKQLQSSEEDCISLIAYLTQETETTV